MGLGNLATLARIDELTLAIAEDRFGEVLTQVVREVGGVDHVMIFAYSPRQQPRAVVNCGSIDAGTAAAAAARYCANLYLVDPNYAALRRRRDGLPDWFDCDRPGDYCTALRSGFFESCGITDLTAFAVCQDRVVYYLMFLRTEGRGYTGAQRWLLKELGEMIAAHVRKHFSHIHAVAGKDQFLIRRVLQEAPVFAALTPREAMVCTGILTGHTSESIGINLQISINSVLTYRKRLYQKLAISSQNELFITFIGAMLALSRDDGGAAPGLLPLHREDTRTTMWSDMEREAVMAEAFLA